jgi:hypothetical protein
MALITKFERKPEVEGQLHKGVIGHFKVFSHDGQQPVLQIDTYGTAAREKPGKLSQTIQLSESSAKELWALLGETYGFGR